MSGSRLGIVLLNWNQRRETIDCVRSLAAALPQGARVWIVDNGSGRAETTALRKELPESHLIASPTNLGFAGGSNLGIEAAMRADRDPILLFNNDARIDRQNLDRLLGSIADRPDPVILGPLLYDASEPTTLLAAGGRDIGLHVQTHLERLPTTDLERVDYVPGTCALLRAALVEAVGLLEESYFFSGEMADYCHRARDRGFEVLVDRRARALHHPGAAGSLRDTLYAYYSLRNRFLYVRRHHSGQKFRLMAIWALTGLRMWRAAGRAGQVERARAMRMACVDGLLGRFGPQNDRILKGRRP